MRDEPLDPDDLRGLVAAAARLLPAQGPISSFVALNPLHGFEDRPFEQAVEEAARPMHAQPYLEESVYREALARGRIQPADIDAVLADDLGPRAAAPLAGGRARLLDVQRVLLTKGLKHESDAAVRWTLTESDATERLRPDLDPDALVHPPLIRLVSAYLDQGVADWGMADRDRGLLAAVAGVASRFGPEERWGRGLRRRFAEIAARCRVAADPSDVACDVIAEELAGLAVARGDRAEVVDSSLLAALGGPPGQGESPLVRLLPAGLRASLYRIALERGFEDAWVGRFVVAPVLAVLQAAALERRLGPQLAGGSLVHLNGLTAILLPLVAIVGLAIALVAPRRAVTVDGITRLLAGASLTAAFMTTSHPVALVTLWVASLVPTWLSTRATPGGRPTARVYALLMTAGSLLFALGVGLMTVDPPWAPEAGPVGAAGGWLVAGAVMIRKGIVPFHSWYPALFTAAPMSAALAATMPQVASYAAIRLLVGHADGVRAELVVLSQAALVTAAYGAALAVVQRDVRGLVGTLALSQSAMVLAGLAGGLPMELCGALAVWVSSGLALTGIGLVTWALESRAGALELDSPQGRFADAPALAGLFLLFGLGLWPGPFVQSLEQVATSLLGPSRNAPASMLPGDHP